MRLPTDQQRTAVIGSTGSGKTQFACWLLSTRRYDLMPWIIFDFKGDELIEDIEKAGGKEISLNDPPPKKPGIYIVRPLADTEFEAIEKFLWKVHAQQDVGIYIDEGYMVDKRSKAFKALLTQGRSKHIPMIVLCQRPMWISRFVFSESNFFAVFRLTDADDATVVKRFIGDGGRSLVNRGLPEYHCVWFDVGGGAGNGVATLCKPVPKAEVILQSFKARLGRKKKQQVTV